MIGPGGISLLRRQIYSMTWKYPLSLMPEKYKDKKIIPTLVVNKEIDVNCVLLPQADHSCYQFHWTKGSCLFKVCYYPSNIIKYIQGMLQTSLNFLQSHPIMYNS